MDNLIRVEHGLAYLNADVSRDLAEFERKIKELKEKEEKLKAQILEEMAANNIKKIETMDVVITFIESTDRETFNTKLFRADHGDLYDEYVEFTPVKPSVRIKVK